MPVLNLSVTISDADYPRLMAAARITFGKVADGEGERDLTDTEIVERLRLYGMSQMIQMVAACERRVAMAAAEALTPTLDLS